MCKAEASNMSSYFCLFEEGHLQHDIWATNLKKVKKAIFQAVKNEPFARAMNMKRVKLEKGRSVVHMTFEPEKMNNIYDRAHGGAMFALIDEALETAGQTDGTVAVALNGNVTYMSSP